MPSTVFKRRLSHPPQVVWKFLADLRNDPIWRCEIIRAELVRGAPYVAGAEYRERVAWEGVEADASLVVAEVVTGSGLVVVSEDPGYRSISKWQFNGDSLGTDLQLEFSLEASGPLRLVEPFLWALLNRWLERDLDTLNERIPTNSAG